MIKSIPFNNNKDNNRQSLVIETPPYFIEFVKKTEEDVTLKGSVVSDQVVERIDPFFNHSTLISYSRSKRPQPDMKISEDNKEDYCLFDHLDDVAHPIIEYDEWGVYQAPNPFAFNPGFHDLIVSKDHIDTISNIERKHVFGIISALSKRAKEITLKNNVNQVAAGINFGTDKEKYPAGASQPHLHAQIGAVYKESFFPLYDKYEDIINKFHKKGIDYINLYNQALRSSDLVIHETDNFIVFAPFSPRFKDEIHIQAKNRDIGNLSSLNEDSIEELSNILYKVLRALSLMQFKNKDGNDINAGIRSVNVDFLGKRTDSETNVGMYIMIMPRQSDLAYSELMGRFVIDRFPEDTKKAIENEFFNEN
ncbi:MAG: hypothetical protein ACYDAS_02885 [Patescibacteria group bacterium]